MMIMGGKERLGAGHGIVDIFSYRPGNGKPVEGGSAAADFVQHDERERRGVVQDIRRFRHLYHEGRAAGSEVVGRADAGEDAVNYAEASALSRNKRTHLRH